MKNKAIEKPINVDTEDIWTKSYLSPTLGAPFPVCFNVFKRKRDFMHHIRKHGIKPYSCHICSEKFNHRNTMMNHVKNHSGEKQFACPYCPQCSSKKSNIKAHILRVHSDEQYSEPLKIGKMNISDVKLSSANKIDVISEVPEEITTHIDSKD